MSGEQIVARARALVGARFRPQGRSVDGGYDCVGLVGEALGLGCPRADYRLRGGSREALGAELAAAGLQRVCAAEPGDILVMRAGPEQLHLGIATGTGFVHADARLRQVVDRPGAPPWPVLEVWRKGEGRG